MSKKANIPELPKEQNNYALKPVTPDKIAYMSSEDSYALESYSVTETYEDGSSSHTRFIDTVQSKEPCFLPSPKAPAIQAHRLFRVIPSPVFDESK